MDEKESLRREFESYDPEEDIKKSGGSYGLTLADRAVKAGIIKLPRLVKKDSEEREKIWRIARVALKRFPALQRGESISDVELRRRLHEIREAGYSVESYSKMSKDEKWNYLMQLRRDIGAELRENYPDLARQIRSENQRMIDEEGLCR